VFSLHHHDEEDSAFVPAAEPADPPIIDTIAQRHRLAKPKELCLNVHGSRPNTSMARLGRTVNPVCAAISCGMLPTVYHDLSDFGLPFVTPDDSAFPGLLLEIQSHPEPIGPQAPSDTSTAAVLLNRSEKAIVTLTYIWRYTMAAGHTCTSRHFDLGTSMQMDVLTGRAGVTRDRGSFFLPGSKRLITQEGMFGDNSDVLPAESESHGGGYGRGTGGGGGIPSSGAGRRAARDHRDRTGSGCCDFRSSGQFLRISVEGHDEKEIAHHIKYLWDKRMIRGDDCTHLTSPYPEVQVVDITPAGHRFLDERELEPPSRRIGFL
jgi:hypothetical protein